MMLKPRLMVKPVQALISLNEAKAHLRVDHGDDDPLIAGLVAAVESHLDGYSGILDGRALMAQTWAQDFGSFACLRLAVKPVVSAAVSYRDAAGAALSVGAGVFAVREDALGPYLALLPDQSWPSSLQSRDDAVTVTYVAGYASPGEVPEAIRHAALMLISHWYENREAAGDAMADVPMGVDRLLASYTAKI